MREGETDMSYDDFSDGYRDRYIDRDGFGADEEMYVYDQCCENCRYYCGWGEERQRGCKLYTRDDYERFPKTRWCYQWNGKKQSHRERCGEKYNEGYGDY